MRFFLAAAVVLTVQWAVVSRASIGCATPDLPLALALYIGLHAERRFPLLGLWVFGLAIDLLGPYPTGMHSLAFLALAQAARGLAGRFDPASVWVRLTVLGFGTLSLRAAQLGVLSWEAGFPPASRASHFVLTSAALTAAVGFLAFQFFDRIGRGDEKPPVEWP
jgi:rod shape-determining protein MreD